MSVTAALWRHYSRSVPGTLSPLEQMQHSSAPGKKYAYMNVYREPGGDKIYTAKMVFDG